MAKVITVFGGVGAQGSAVVKALLQRGDKYAVRVATRDVNSDKAKALAAQGVTLVKASYDDYASTLAAVTGAYGVWFITSFWDTRVREKELEQGGNVAKAAKAAGVQHLVFSSLGSPREYGLNQVAFENKVDIEHHIRELGVPHTFVNVAWYLNNFESFAKPQKYDPNGPYVIALPIGAHGMHAINNADVGEVFARVFDERDAYLGRKIAVAGTLIASTQQVADAFSAVFAPAKFVAQSDFEAFKAATAASFGDVFHNMYKFYDLSHASPFDVTLTKTLNPNTVTSVTDYLVANKAKFTF